METEMALRLGVAIAASVAICLAVLLLVRRLTAGGAKGKAAKAGNDTNAKRGAGSPGAAQSGGRGGAAEDGEAPTSDLVPAADVRGCVLLGRDGSATCYLRVEPKNNSLLNAEEQVAEIEATARALANVSYPFKVVHLQVPIDTTRNLARIDEVDEGYVRRIGTLGDSQADRRERRQLEIRRELLANYRARAEYEVRAAEKMRSETYVVVPEAPGESSPAIAEQRARDLEGVLKLNGFDSRVLFGPEIVAMLLSYQGAHRSAGENLEPYAGFPVVPGVVEARYPEGTGEERKVRAWA